jgi:antitoxin component of MazEF toxin-antitoxin module
MVANGMGWNLEVVPLGDELAVIFPDELLEEAGWRVGDWLDFELKGQSVLLRKRTNPRQADSA